MSTFAERYCVKENEIFCSSPSGDCVRASVANALAVHDGAGKGTALAMLKSRSMHAKSLSEAGVRLEKNFKNIT